MQYTFEWDPPKASTNRVKHGIGFEQAAEVFFDPLHIAIVDEEHSDIEERWITLGKTKNHALVVVVHTFSAREDGVTIRIISARQATNHERRQYEEIQ